MNVKKNILLVLLATATFALAGCGNDSIMEEYSFGYTQLQEGNSEVYGMTPVQLGEMHNSDGTSLYGANDAHWDIVVESRPAGSTTIQQWAAEPISLFSKLKQAPTISDLQTKSTETTVLNKAALDVERTFELSLGTHQAKMVGRSLFFEDNGQIWNITYLYNAQDPVGKEVIDYVFGKIN